MYKYIPHLERLKRGLAFRLIRTEKTKRINSVVYYYACHTKKLKTPLKIYKNQ